MNNDRWVAPILELDRPMAAYLLWLIARDLPKWGTERRTKLTREDATALAMHLSDHLPVEARTKIEPVPPPGALLRAS